jgi:hypothetical protein
MRAFLGLIMGLSASACGDAVVEAVDLEDVSAVWELSANQTSNTCGSVNGGPTSDRIILIQCGSQVSLIAGEGLWGSGTVLGRDLSFTGTEVQTDETGCRSTHRSTGTVSGSESLLEGDFSTQVTYDLATCGAQPPCSIETAARLTLVAAYGSCLGRDVFGAPAMSDYVLPWPAGKSYRVSNGYCIPTGGHREQQAYDFQIPIGEPILAARSGLVRQIKESSPDDGRGSEHNHVMVEHSDGTVAFYAHLMQDGVLVEVGENVEAGQTIAFAGHSGTTDVVHLHFGVYASWPPTEGADRAISFRNAEGPLDCRGGLVNGATYTAMN